MGDLETRLAEGLAGTAGRAPHPVDLAAGARGRLRRRRRTTGAVVAAAVAVAAIPVSVAVVGGTDGEDPDRRDPTTVSETPVDWRTETWRDLSVGVPPGWTWGGGTDWCADGGVGSIRPQASRPGVVPAIGCDPSYGYGAHFLEPSDGELPPGTEGVVQQYRGDRYPDGAWIGYASTRQAAVWVVAEDRAQARQVLDSATPVGEVDANGCATQLVMAAPTARDRVSVCRYDGDGWLEQSELLSPADSRRAVAAVSAAPQSGPAARRCTWERLVEMPAITLGSADFNATVIPQGCKVVDPAGGVVPRRLTEEVLYWALSPGWNGTVGEGVPLPERLRGR